MRKPPPDLDLFSQLKERILHLDPVSFCEHNLRLDGAPFRLQGNGYKPFADVYRYIGLKAIEENSKPVVMVKGRQVGATTMGAALELYFMASGAFGTQGRPPMRLMHLFPSLPLAAAYTKDKLSPMLHHSRLLPNEFRANGHGVGAIDKLLDRSSPTNDTLLFKKFVAGNQIWIESTGIDGGRVRGRTVDGAFFDEVQDMPRNAIGAVTKILSQALYGAVGKGLQIYFGTPKQKGSTYYRMWEESSQQYYHLRCLGCHKLFPLYRPDVDWEEIWLYGYTVRCPECKYEQDKRKSAEGGQWVPVDRGDGKETRFVGYHLNQLYIPRFTKEVIVDAKPENNATNTEMLYKNEVLGEFYDGAGGPITPEEIIELCGDKERRFSPSIHPSEEIRVYAGFDWGQKGDWSQVSGKQRGQSYSCGVIITAIGPQIFNIEFALRLEKTDPAYKENLVEELFRRYAIDLAVGDIGDAYDLTHILQRKHNDRFLASRAVPRIQGYVKYTDDVFPKEIVFQRDYYISELTGLFKAGAIRFPLKSYERMHWLIQHCSSMETKITTDRHGEPIRRFVKGSAPNDGFMALLNAYLAWKFDVTDGFTTSDPTRMNFDRARHKVQIPAVLGYFPRL